MQIIYTASDNLIQVTGLTNALTGAVLASATVTVTLNDPSGAPIAGQAFPLTLAATSTPGNYAATLLHALTLVGGSLVYADVTINAGAGLYRSIHLPLQVSVDDGSTST
jgi:hypothetical protein